jgi:hypothetical protein
MHEFETALRLFLAGHTSIVETKAALLKGFPGPRAPHEALLLADFVEDVALSVRAGRAGVAEAVSDLVQVRGMECEGACHTGTVH